MALKEAGFEVRYEQKGGLTDKRRPGDVMVLNWEEGRHLLLDVAVINPLCESHRGELEKWGAGAAADAYEQKKIDTYPEYKKKRVVGASLRLQAPYF